jgi:hypothetical protein
VTVVSRATPRVAVRPGRAPKTMPRITLPKSTSRFTGLAKIAEKLPKKVPN